MRESGQWELVLNIGMTIFLPLVLVIFKAKDKGNPGFVSTGVGVKYSVFGFRLFLP